MLELLPESWRMDPAAQQGCCSHSKRPRRAMVTDVLIWAECYTTMAAILSAAYPDKAPHFFAHMRTVVKVARNFEGTAWASYDLVVRHQAANRGSTDWGSVENAIYSEAFTGRAQLIPRCAYCLGDTHASHECAYAPVPAELPPVPTQGGGSGQGTSTPSPDTATGTSKANSPYSRNLQAVQCGYMQIPSVQVCPCLLPVPAPSPGDRMW